MRNKKLSFVLQALLGVVLLTIGSFVLTSDDIKMLSGLFIGFGSAMLALGIGSFVQALIIPAAKHEEIEKLKDIEVKDERNIMIREKAGYMTAKIMNYVLIVFLMTLGFMGVDKLIIIMTSGLIIIEAVLVVFFSDYFAKKI